jgi:hypothetical protein
LLGAALEPSAPPALGKMNATRVSADGPRFAEQSGMILSALVRRSFPSVATCVALLILTPGSVRAEEPVSSSPHRIGGALGAGTAFESIARDGSEELRFKGIAIASAQASYGYKVVDGLELGAGVGYWNASELNGFALRGKLRPYLPLGARVEIGLPVSAGLLVWPHAEVNEELWVGWSGSVNLDCRIWIDRRYALELYGGGDGGHVTGPSIHGGAGFVSLGGGIGFLAGI